MKIDLATKIIGRFHKEASPRGLYAVYLLFHNPDPSILIPSFLLQI